MPADGVQWVLGPPNMLQCCKFSRLVGSSTAVRMQVQQRSTATHRRLLYARTCAFLHPQGSPGFWPALTRCDQLRAQLVLDQYRDILCTTLFMKTTHAVFRNMHACAMTARCTTHHARYAPLLDHFPNEILKLVKPLAVHAIDHTILHLAGMIWNVERLTRLCAEACPAMKCRGRNSKATAVHL